MKIKLISTSKELALVRRIRKKVLELEQGFPHEVNIDGNDPRAVHALIYDGHKPVATARLLPTEKGRGKIARIAIISEKLQFKGVVPMMNISRISSGLDMVNKL